jgi:hypothetical protein
MINLPNDNKKWSQVNNSDLFGNISITKNISFDKEGYLALSNSSRAIMDEIVDIDFALPVAIAKNEDYGYLVVTSDQLFQVNSVIMSVTPSQIATAGVPAGDLQSDVTYFEDKLVVTQDTDVDYYDTTANTWTDTNISLTADGHHPAVYMPSLSALAIADVYTVKLYAKPITATPTLITTLTIANNLEITSMCYFNQNLYIATHNPLGGHAWLYVWNGLGTSAQQAYEVDSNIIFSVCMHQDSVVLTTGNGSLLRFNGSGFTMLAGFPIFYTDQSLSGDTNKSMYHNTLKSNGDVLYIGLSSYNENGDDFLLSQPDGIWCYDENVGLYHKYSTSNAMVIAESIINTSINTSTNIITVANNYITGTEVVFYQGSGVSPLVSGTKYFVINVSSTTIKLATTKTNALAGTAIDITSVTAGTNYFAFFRNIDFGQFINDRFLSLYVIERPVTHRILGTDLLWGAEVIRRDAISNYDMLGSISKGVEARGYFITPKITSQDVTDVFNQITVKFTAPLGELDKIIIKYRTEDDGNEFVNLANWDITWTSTTTFTTTETGWASATVGDEVEILAGAGAGILAHISTITESSGTYTVTIDESFDYYTSGDIAVAIFRNWTKWQTITSTNTLGYLSEQLGVTGKFLQLKIELRGVEVQIEEIKVDNKFMLPAKR